MHKVGQGHGAALHGPEKPLQWEACATQLLSSSHSLQLEKSPHSIEDPGQPEINK